jgi:hypothetical protein
MPFMKFLDADSGLIICDIYMSIWNIFRVNKEKLVSHLSDSVLDSKEKLNGMTIAVFGPVIGPFSQVFSCLERLPIF